MAKKDQTSKETPIEETSEEIPEETSKVETSEETVGEKETLPGKKPPELEVDYRIKFRESQREAIRLKKELEKAEKKPSETVETETEGETLDQIVDKKVEEKVAPLIVQQETEKVDKWLAKHPEAYDYLRKIEDSYLEVPGKTPEEKLENAFLIASKDAAKEAGKKEMAFTLYQKEQAVASGGGATSSGTESLPPLTEEEKQVALGLGLSEEAYAKRKTEKTKK